MKLTLLFIFLNFGISSFAQNTVAELGKTIYLSFKSGDLERIYEHILSTEQSIQLAEKWDVEMSEEDMIKFKNVYPERVKKYKEFCVQLLLNDSTMGFRWVETEYKNSEVSQKKLKISEDETKNKIDVTNLIVHFMYKNKEFKLFINSVIELDEKWYLGGSNMVIHEVEVDNK